MVAVLLELLPVVTDGAVAAARRDGGGALTPPCPVVIVVEFRRNPSSHRPSCVMMHDGVHGASRRLPTASRCLGSGTARCLSANGESPDALLCSHDDKKDGANSVPRTRRRSPPGQGGVSGSTTISPGGGNSSSVTTGSSSSSTGNHSSSAASSGLRDLSQREEEAE